MYSVRLALFITLIVLLSSGEAGPQKVLTRSKRNHVSCRPKSLVSYRLTVHTLWSKETFPKMFPTYRPHAQWSSLVGHTHGSVYQMWTEGENSTLGVKTFAELGDPSQLNIESFQGYNDILDSFVAPPVNRSVGQTSAVIILDGHHSKLSFMMRIIPSPDWFVGVSSLDLCAQGRWKNKVQVDLHPFDAGTDQGLTFTAPNWPNTPPLPISAITSSYPDHPASSFFYPEYKELPHLAFLDLDIVSEFRHKETFMNIPQHYKPSTDENDERDDDKKTKDVKLSSTTTEVESETPKFHPSVSERYGENAARRTNNYPSVKKDLTAVNINGFFEKSVTNEKGDQVSEVKGRIFTAKDVKEDEMNIYGKHDATSDSIADTRKEIDDLSFNAPSETIKEETSVQYKKDVQADNSLDRDTKRQINFTRYTGSVECHSNISCLETRGANNQNDKTSRTVPFTSLSGLHRGSNRTHLKSHATMSASLTKRFTALNQAVTHNYGRSRECVVDEWSVWSQCSQTCGFGKQERSRNVLSYHHNGGVTCPPLRETKTCGSMKTCDWNHFSFLKSNVTNPQQREGPARYRAVRKRKVVK